MQGRTVWVLVLGLAGVPLSGCGARTGLDHAPTAPDAAVGLPDAAPPPSATQCLLLGAYGDPAQTVTSTWRWDGATWKRLTPSTVPSARSDAVASALGTGVVAFGGWAYFVESYGSEIKDTDQTWVWTGSDWAMPSLGASSPPARNNAAMAALDGNVVLFGGDSSPDPLGDTWTYDGRRWTQATPSASPTARTGAAMAAFNGALILFGGVVGVLSGASRVNDTWKWDGSSWTQLMPKLSPPPRTSAAMQLLGGRLILFGGQHVGVSGGSERINDTWAWDGETWTELSPGVSPPARAYAASGVIGDRMFVAGGQGQAQALDDTWAFDGSTWTELAVSGPGVDELGFGTMACF
jgi:Kelch motif/Galactose oxidase, central domain